MEGTKGSTGKNTDDDPYFYNPTDDSQFYM